MTRHFVRFLSESLLGFETHLEHQSATRRTVKLHFDSTEIDCCMYDSVLPQDVGPALHRGLGIDVYVDGANDDAVQRARSFCERWLALLSYSQMSPCGPLRLELAYDAGADKQNREFTFVATRTPVKFGSLRKIDVGLFHAMTEGQHFDDEPKWLALEWFRKGLAEEHTLDEFVAYWSALEIMAGALRKTYAPGSDKSYRYCPTCKERIATCPHCGGDAGTPSPWSGIFQLIDQGIGLDRKDFSAVRRFRGGMLHGGTDLSMEAVERIKARELVALRRLVVFAIGGVFGPPKDVTQRIASQSVHRVVTPVSTKFFGTLDLNVGAPPAIENVALQPMLRANIKSERQSLDEQGRLSVSGDLEYQTNGANFKVNRFELWADESGISGATISDPTIVRGAP